MGIKPILFNTDMVRAILDGKKTVTRRAVKGLEGHRPYSAEPAEKHYDDLAEWDFICGQVISGGMIDYAVSLESPYQPGNILYVRETWRPTGEIAHPYAYKADEKLLNLVGENGKIVTLRYRWRSSIHMPREAARIFLRVTGVRVERLQDITLSDCKAEGTALRPKKRGDEYDFELDPDLGYWFEFQLLWESTIKPEELNVYGWNENPWVWVIKFERCEKPDGWPK